jgi:hypothetical protein
MLSLLLLRGLFLWKVESGKWLAPALAAGYPATSLTTLTSLTTFLKKLLPLHRLII